MVSHCFEEFVPVTAGRPLRQGDILEAVDLDASERHLMVITADCDLAHKKHGGRITCIPFLDAEAYLRDTVLEKIGQQLKKKALDESASAISRSLFPRLTRERLAQWALEEDAELIASELKLKNQTDRQTVMNSMTALRLLPVPGLSYSNTVEQLHKVNASLTNPQKPEVFKREIHSRVKNVFQNTPGDVFFLSTIGNELDAGYFAQLRHVIQIHDSSIALVAMRQAVSHRRIGAVRETYVHAMVQQFALVFMSIGMPDEYENRRGVLVDRIIKR